MPIVSLQMDLAQVLAGAAAEGDALRLSELQRLSSQSAGERAALAVERDRLRAKYGADSPQAAAAAARLDLLDQERAMVDAELIRESTPAPQTAGDHFIVYGRVLDAKGAGVPRMIVGAIPPQGSVLARARTAVDGGFALRVKVPATSVAGQPAASGSANVTFRLEVSGRNPRVMYLNDEVFEAIPNRMAYRELILPV